MRIRFLDDLDLVNEESGADYRAGGATWNFPNGERGVVHVRFQLPEGTGGVRLSLADRLFNACDVEVVRYAIFTGVLEPGGVFGSERLEAGRWYTMSLEWGGVTGQAVCRITLDGAPAGTWRLNRESPNGISYLHFVSTADGPDEGMIVDAVRAEVR